MKEIKKNSTNRYGYPGRLLDLMRRKTLNLSAVKFVVLDEADEMLNMGFKDDLDDILSTPETIKTWLFSATMPKRLGLLLKITCTTP